MLKKICIVTGTRAEYGLLKMLIKRIIADPELQLLLYVTGAHLSSEFGMTFKEIEEDNIPIERKIEILLSADTSSGVAKSMGIEMISLADAFSEDMPDLLIILGDRYEMLVAAMEALIFKIPIAHIHGGEVTEGAIDEAIRHSITKMSYLHFTSTEEYRKRVIQLGEDPDRVYNVGSLGIENIKSFPLMNKKEIENEIGISLDGMVAMVTYHPVTLESTDKAQNQFEILLRILEDYPEMKIIFTKSNADMGGRVINDLINKFVKKHQDTCIAFDSLGQLRYLSVLQFCTIVIGNSSSGIIEVPSFYIPTINIGDRQKGRMASESVINCGTSIEEIRRALSLGLSESFRKSILQVKNPYELSGTSAHIIEIIKDFLRKGINIKKIFYDL